MHPESIGLVQKVTALFFFCVALVGIHFAPLSTVAE